MCHSPNVSPQSKCFLVESSISWPTALVENRDTRYHQPLTYLHADRFSIPANVSKLQHRSHKSLSASRRWSLSVNHNDTTDIADPSHSSRDSAYSSYGPSHVEIKPSQMLVAHSCRSVLQSINQGSGCGRIFLPIKLAQSLAKANSKAQGQTTTQNRRSATGMGVSILSFDSFRLIGIALAWYHCRL